MKVTTIGGGTGSFHLLLALKKIDDIEINSIVSVSDNGGSTGKLRTFYGILPPGDIRNCLIALSDDAEIWNKIFNHRFDEKIDEHSLGNLILTALKDITGSFEKGLKLAHQILDIKKHNVIPVTYSKTQLVGEFQDGEKVKGETQLRQKGKQIKKLSLQSDSKIYPNSNAIQAILESDFILIAPGSLYSSILPNLLIKDIPRAIKKNNKADKIFIQNIMTESGETKGYQTIDFVDKIKEFIDLDYILVNSKQPDEDILKEYQKEDKELVKMSEKFQKENKDKIIQADLLNENDIIRHDPFKLSKILQYVFLKKEKLSD